MATQRKQSPAQIQHAIFLKIIDILWTYDGAGMQNLADEARVHFTTLYNWRTGMTLTPRLDTVARVAYVLGYDLELVKSKSRTAPKKHLRLVKC